LRSFLDSVGLPEVICVDNAKEQTSGKWNDICREFGIKPRLTEPYKHRQNYAENAVMLVKFRTFRIMDAINVPTFLWDHALEYAVQLSNKSYHPTYRLEGRTPYEMVMGLTPDISPFMDFTFYQLIFYIVNNPGRFPSPKKKIGRWLGPSKQISSDLVYKVLTQGGLIVMTSAVFPILQEDLDTPGINQRIAEYDQRINEIITPGSIKRLAQDFGLEDAQYQDPLSSEVGKHRGVPDNAAQVSQLRGVADDNTQYRDPLSSEVGKHRGVPDKAAQVSQLRGVADDKTQSVECPGQGMGG